MTSRTVLVLLAAAVSSGCAVVGAPTPAPSPVPHPDTGVPSGVEVDVRAAPSYDGLRPVRRFSEVRGLWVVRSSMTSEAEVRDMVSRAASAGFNTLIVQVRGRGDAFYRSTLEPRAETITDPEGFDPLALTIEEGHRRGLAVHAWVNTHLVWGPAPRPRSADHLLNASPEWLAVPRELAPVLFSMAPEDAGYVDRLRQYAEENRGSVEGIFSSPSHPGVQERVREVWMDLLQRYDLDGIHFDYIRFSSSAFDYSRGAMERFRAWVGVREGDAADPGYSGSFASAEEALAYVDARPELWAEFRRSQITDLVRRIYRDVKARRPEVVVSAAVIADADDAYRHRFQDWRSWLAEGILDIAVPMAYTPDNARFDALVADARGAAGSRERTWAGIGAYLTGLGGTIEKIDLARGRDVGGIVLFSYDWAVHEAPGEDDDPFLEAVSRARFRGGS